MSLYLFLCHLAIISRFIWYRTTQSHPPIQSLRSTCTPLLSLPLYSSLLIPPLAPPPHSSLKSPSFHCSSISVLDPSSTGPRRLTSPLNSLLSPPLLPLYSVYPSLSSVLFPTYTVQAKNNFMFKGNSAVFLSGYSYAWFMRLLGTPARSKFYLYVQGFL